MKTPLLFFAMLTAAAASAWAQQPPGDQRWEAFYGCWKAENPSVSPTGQVPTVCVVPASRGVDVLTVVDTSVVARDHIDALAGRHEVSRENCTGFETDVWARDGGRLYRRSEFTCPGEVKRATSEIIAMTPDWQWVDVQGLVSHGSMGVRTLRYGVAVVPPVPEIATALSGHAAVGMARGAAATPPTTTDVIEATREADPAVVEAWLAEEGEGFPLSGKQLEALADSGVPPRVIDIMVALTYPKAFTVAAPSARGGFNPALASERSPMPDTTTYAYHSPYDIYGFYPGGWDYYSPWSWSMYGYYSPFFYSPYGQFAPYGWGGYGGYYYGGGTIVVVSGGGGGNSPQPPHGRIVKGHGYEYPSGSSGTSRPTSSESSAGSSGSSGSAAAAPRSSGSGSSSQVGQHAHPKP